MSAFTPPMDLNDCVMCLKESFYRDYDERDETFLMEYTKVMIEKSNFVLVAECDGIAVGVLCGLYKKGFDRKLSKSAEHERHYGGMVKMFLKYYLRMYGMSPGFRKEFELGFAKIRERPQKVMENCDLELAALISRKDYRKGVGTALMAGMIAKCRMNGVRRIRVHTNTAASYTFYDKYGSVVYRKNYDIDGTKGTTLIYEMPSPTASGKG